LAQLVVVAIGAICGLAAIGSIRAAQLIVAPVQVLSLGVGMVATAEAVRALSKSLVLLLRLSAAASLGLAIACLVWGGVSLLLPSEIGRLLLHDTWEPARTYLPAGIASQLGQVLFIGPFMTVRAFANARLSLKVTALTTAVGVAVPLFGASMGGLEAAWGLAAASLAGAAIWWLAVPSAVRNWRERGVSRGRVTTA
jgi:hypothetical protein